MLISRRGFLNYTGPLAALPFLPKECSGPDDYTNSTPPFLHGVASGDPTAESVILWTRITGDTSAPEVIDVRYEVANDPQFSRVVTRGSVATDASADFTVKIDATRLRPGRTYFYRFEALGHRSMVGRTRTLPKGSVARLRFAVASCSNYPYGYFNAYRAIAERADLDAVLHLGDYLYEYANAEYGDGTALGRIPQPDREIVTLADYRLRHATYKTDPDLQEAHRQHPFITVWDDHESANDAFEEGAQNHDPTTEGDWQARKAAAIQAYFEWMPIRPPSPDASGRIYRAFAYGDLADLILLDTRLLARDQQVDACDLPALADPSRELLGAEQHDWFAEQLLASQACGNRWRLIGQQVMFGQLMDVLTGGGCVLNPDQWDGYAAARARVLSVLAENEVDNVVLLTGDIHSSWAMDITGNPFDPASYQPATGTGSVAVEFVAPAVTSPGIDDPAQALTLATLVRQTHPHIKYAELNRRGYLLLDLTPERIQAEWYHLTTIQERSADEALAAVFVADDGANHVVPGSDASTPRSDAPPLAPDYVPASV